jgi:subtilisin family serine protease
VYNNIGVIQSSIREESMKKSYFSSIFLLFTILTTNALAAPSEYESMKGKFENLASVNAETDNHTQVTAIIGKRDYWYYQKNAAKVNDKRQKFYARIVSIYERIIQRYEDLYKRVDSFPPALKDRIQNSSWYKRSIQRLPIYRQRIDYYKAKITQVFEIKRKYTFYTDKDEANSSKPSEVITSSTTNYEQDGWKWEKVSETLRVFIDVTITSWRDIEIYYSDGTTKLLKDQNKRSYTYQYAKIERTETHNKLEQIIEEVIVPVENFETTEYKANYGLTSIGAKTAYEQGYTGKGVTVAVLDTGVDSDNANLPNVLAGGRFVGDSSTSTEDGHGHGTHVAGIIAGAKNDSKTHGVAFEATILPVKVLQDSGSGSLVDIMSGISYASDRGAEVMNISIGATDFQNYTQVSAQTVAALDKANQAGSFVAVAAGNSGLSCKDTHTNEAYKYLGVICSWPAALPSHADLKKYFEADLGWVSVGAIDENDNIASWSNRAGIMKDYYIVAPGVNITSDSISGGSITMSGTSMAAPHVAGAAALLFQKYPHLKGKSIQDIMLWTADDLGVVGVDDIYGHGKLNVDAAFTEGDNLILANGTLASNYKASTSAIIGTAFGTALNSVDSLSTVALVGSSTDDTDNPIYYDADFSDDIIGVAPSFSFEGFEKTKIGNNTIVGIQSEGKLIKNLMVGYENNGISVNLAQTRDLFGTSDTSMFGDARTIYTSVGYQDAGLSASVTYAYGSADVGRNSLVSDLSSVSALGMDARYGQKYSKNTSWYIGASVPLRVVQGEMNVSSSVLSTAGAGIQQISTSHSLTPDSTEVNLVTGLNHKTGNWNLSGLTGATTNAGHNSNNDVDYFVNFEATMKF